MKQFHLLKERFLFDDYDSGLYFDLFTLKRPAGDEDVFNGVINEACEALEEITPDGQKWLPTLMLLESQVNALPVKYRTMFAGKSYLMLYKANFNEQELPNNEWGQMGGGMLICKPVGAKANWKYFTEWDANALGHRFRRVDKSEVDAYDFGEPVTPPVNPPADDDTTGDTTLPSGGLTLHLVCPHCKKAIF
jgi:hypothetical protein